MAVKTSNVYGQITVSNQASRIVCDKIIRDVYGVAGLVDGFFTKTRKVIMGRLSDIKGIKIKTIDNKIYVNINVYIKYGLSISAVADSIKKSVKYGLEEFTGMIVDCVNVKIKGIKP